MASPERDIDLRHRARDVTRREAPALCSTLETTQMQTRRKRIVLALAATATVASIGVGAVSLALFTSTATVPANTFSTGSVIITTSPTTALVTFSAMAPADQVTAPITVTNGGTLALRYALSSVSTNVDTKALKDQLVLTVKTGVTTCTDAAYGATGVVQYTGDLDSSAGLLIGNAATGQSGGAFPTVGADRVLAAAANEVLCFNVTLPSSTGDAFQLAATTATFTFAAEQTKNN
jgi:hypothetical protein